MEGKTEDQIAKETLMQLAKKQFLPALKEIDLNKEERALVKELEEGSVKADDDLKIEQLRKLFIKYKDKILAVGRTSKEVS